MEKYRPKFNDFDMIQNNQNRFRISEQIAKMINEYSKIKLHQTKFFKYFEKTREKNVKKMFKSS